MTLTNEELQHLEKLKIALLVAMHAPLQPIVRRGAPARDRVVDDVHNVHLLLLRVGLHLYPAPDAVRNRPGQIRVAADVHDCRLDQTADLVRVRRRDGVRRLEHFAEPFEGAPSSDDLPELGRQFEGRSLAEEWHLAHFGRFAKDEAKVDVLEREMGQSAYRPD